MIVYSAVGHTLSEAYGLLLRTILCDVIVYSYCTCTCLSSAVYCMYFCLPIWRMKVLIMPNIVIN